MAYFAPEHWVALSALAAVGMITILNVLARRFEHEREVHDLRLRASALRKEYAERMAALKEANTEAVEVGEIPAVAGAIAPEPTTVVIAA